MSVQRGFPNAGHFYSNIVKPIKIDLNFIVDAANGNGLGVRSIKSNGFVNNVFMHTSSTPGVGGSGITNPNPASGYALIQMKQNFNSYLGGFTGFVSPTTGSTSPISGSGLTVGNPYVIAAVGATPAPKFTVLAIADSSGNSAGKYFTATDASSNNYVFYNVVSGVGLPPSLTGPLANYVAIPVAYATNAANTAVATAVSNAVANVNGGNSFTTSISSATVTVTSAAASTIPLPLAPNAQTSGFTVGAVTYTALAADWQHVGVPAGLTPSVGLSFIAKTTGGSLGSGTVIAPGVSGITSIEVIGNANASINNADVAANGGAWIMVQFLGASGSLAGSALGTHTHDLLVIGGQAASTTNDIAAYAGPILGKEQAANATFLGSASATNGGVVAASAGTPAGTVSLSMAPAAPAANSVVGMSFFFDGSSVTVDGL